MLQGEQTQRDCPVGFNSILAGLARYVTQAPEHNNAPSRRLSAWETELFKPSFRQSQANAVRMIRRHKKKHTQVKIVTEESPPKKEGSPTHHRLNYMMKSVEVCKGFKPEGFNTFVTEPQAIHKSPVHIRRSSILRTTQKPKRLNLSVTQFQRQLPILFGNNNSNQTYLPHHQTRSQSNGRRFSPCKGKSYRNISTQIKEAIIKGILQGAQGTKLQIKQSKQRY